MKTDSPNGICSRAFLRLIIVVACLVSLLSMPQRAVQAASILYVKTDGSAITTCTNWANACKLQTALGRAASGEEIWVKFGTYYPSSSNDRTATFQLVDGVGMYGGFLGTESNRKDADPSANVTTLSGDIGGLGHGDNSYNVVTASGTGSSTVLSGFTITAGYADGNVLLPQSYGGGMYIDTGSPSLITIIFSSNHASSEGGGIFNTNSSPSLTNVTLSDNSVDDFGGGMFDSNNSNPVLSNVTFNDNSATQGGGIYNHSSSPSLTNVTFSGNSADTYGGGMVDKNNSAPVLSHVTFTGNSASIGGGLYNETSSPALSDVTFDSNTADTLGGGMENEQTSNPTLTNVTFKDNASSTGGGGLGNSYSSPTLTNVTFSGNSATGSGGGIYNGNSSPTLTNVTFSGNYTTSPTSLGGGMVNASSSPILNNLTFSGNSADRGGAMANYTSSNPTIGNSILWGNTATSTDPEIYNYSSTPLVSYSDIQGGYAGTGNINADPLLGSLGTYGGSTKVLPLLPGSAAIDSGDTATCVSPDQRGISRPQGSDCDMGAFESRGFTLSLAAGDNQSTLVHTDFATPLSVSISSSYAEPVNGGSIRFSVPMGGASAILSDTSVTIAAGAASVTARANSRAGSYHVTASAAGASSTVIFHLKNIVRIYLPLIFKFAD